MPTRLLWVGNLDDPSYDPNILRLITDTKKNGGKYVALSHCWGNPPTSDSPSGEEKVLCTTQSNLKKLEDKFNFSSLSKNFQDAITVTRELRIPFIWIDSLCIIQQEPDGADWKREVERMQSVYSSAYCTIAATAAPHSSAGFLERNTINDYIHVQDASGRKFYISAGMDDFDNHVDTARLNTRAWVLQERVLSRRTIHFSTNQTYWECGEGVYCENLTRLER
jgi:hypothetical protein